MWGNIISAGVGVINCGIINQRGLIRIAKTLFTAEKRCKY